MQPCRKCLLPYLLVSAVFWRWCSCSADDVADEYIPKTFGRIRSGVEISDAFIRTQTSLDDLRSRIVSPEYKDIPPVPSDGGPLAVGVGVNFVKFKGLNEVQGTFEITIDLQLCWTDERLSFNSGQFFQENWQHAGDKLSIRSDIVWTPDIVVLNEVGGHQSFRSDGSPLVLADDNFQEQFGVNVLWSRRLDVTSRCDVDMSDFPFDMQRCSLIIGSWASSQRQMSLVPQDLGKIINPASSIETQEFNTRNITVTKTDIYTRNSAQTFEEIRYDISLQRYPHFYVINFILPLVAVTMLTVGSMWMRNAAVRMNSATKMLLCVVNIGTVTVKWRPAGHGDIWLDTFQSHCLALSMSAVLQSLIMDYLLRLSPQWKGYGYQTHLADIILRTSICLMAICVMVTDFCTVKKSDTRALFGTFHAHSQQLLVGFVYIVFLGLGISSLCSIFWLVVPQRIWNRLVASSQLFGLVRKASVVLEGHIPDQASPRTPEKTEKEERIQHELP